MKNAFHEKIWVVVPAYNEENSLPQVLEYLLKNQAAIVVVDDGSTDKTKEIAERYPIHVLHHPINLGQGAALQTGFTYALSKGADILVSFDADGQMDENEIPNMCAPLISKSADVTLGTRFLSNETKKNIPRLRRWILSFAVFFTKATSGLNLTDTHNGFRAFTKSSAQKINITRNRMAHASQILNAISRHRLLYKEVPVTIRYTNYSVKKGQLSINSLNILWDLFFNS